MLQSLFRSQILTLYIVFGILLLTFYILFRSLKLAIIGIIPYLLSIIVVLGIMGLANIPLDIMTITIAAISLGIAVDDTIHYIHRFKVAFRKKKAYIPTMYECHTSIGRAMLNTTIVIFLGFSILIFSNFIPSIYFGLLTGIAMMIALILSLTLLPGLIIALRPFGKETDIQK